MKNDLIELYSGYLSSSGKTTATSVSEFLGNVCSHDQFTRLLSNNELTSRDFCFYVKPIVRQVECSGGVLIFADTIQEKQFSKENALNNWRFDHTKYPIVKGISLLNAHYHGGAASVPVAGKLIEKITLYTVSSEPKSIWPG